MIFNVYKNSDLQSAIDKVAESGGGKVVVMPGNHPIDMTILRDNVELYLSEGATLVSRLEQISDLNSQCAEPSCNVKRFLLGGINLKNVSISGKGVIDGRGYEKFWEIDPNKTYPLFGQRYWPKLYRPKGLIHFRESENIKISGVTIINPPCYTVWLLGCDNIEINDIKIEAPLSSPNTDGIDIDCCANVVIDRCDICSGDDAIAVKSDIHELGFYKSSNDIMVKNCRLKTSSCGIRLGYEGDGAIFNCSFENCKIYESMIGISIMSVSDPFNVRNVIIKDGPYIHDVSFINIKIDALQTFNFQHVELNGRLKGYFDRICFNNIEAEAQRGSYIGGLVNRKGGTVEFNDLTMTFSGKMGDDFAEIVPEPYPLWNDLNYSGIPQAFYVRHLEKIVIRNSKFNFNGTNFREILKTCNVDEIETSKLKEMR